MRAARHNPWLSGQIHGSGLPLVTTSWDDGHPADLRVAALLEKHGLSGTFYIPCRNAEGRAVMRPAEVRQLAQGFEIGGHTRDHVSLTQLAPAVAAEQIGGNKRRLEDLLGQDVAGFAYVRGQHNRTVRRLVRQAGFRYARTVTNLSGRAGRDRFRVPATVQFFAHPAATYWRNFLSGGPSLGRLRLLRAVLTGTDLVSRMTRTAEACLGAGAGFHLWGHSWELEEQGLWDELDQFLARLSQFRARFVTNTVWCAAHETAPARPDGNAP